MGANFYPNSYCYLLKKQSSFGPKFLKFSLFCASYTFGPLFQAVIVLYNSLGPVESGLHCFLTLLDYFWIVRFTSIIFGNKMYDIFVIVTCFELKNISERARWSYHPRLSFLLHLTELEGQLLHPRGHL